MLKGLHSQIAQKLSTAKRQKRKAAAVETDPRIAHEAGADADKLEAEAKKLAAMARADEALLPSIELLIHDLETSTHKSAYRTLAMRDLQSASNWLRRELGDKE